MYHPAVAHSQNLVGLTEQATGTDAVCVVSWELLFAGGAAVPPGLGQVGQLSTQRFIRPRTEPPGACGCRENSRLVGDGGEECCDEGDLPSAPDRKQRSGSPERHRSPAGGCREARPDCGSELGCRPPGKSHLQDETERKHGELQRESTREFQMAASSDSLDSV